MCPYYDERYKSCNFFSGQDDSQRQSYCMTDSNWRQCANYYNRTLEEKIKHQRRTNPDL